jgi:transaldolase
VRIHLDSADIAEIRWAAGAGLIDGVTTDPTLLSHAAGARDPHDLLQEICGLVAGPVAAQVVAVDTDGMYREGKELARLADNIVVKIPMIEDGLAAARRLAAEGIDVSVTLVFSAMQGLLAARAGAAYVSPLVGPLDDAGQDGMEVVGQLRAIFRSYDVEAQVVAASLRHPRHALQAALAGADVGAVPPDVLRQLLLHPLTDRGLDRFLNDWSTIGHPARPENAS